jgi:DNA repair protein RAD16
VCVTPFHLLRYLLTRVCMYTPPRLQDKKRLVFEGTVGGDAASLSQLSEDDLRFLFQN